MKKGLWVSETKFMNFAEIGGETFAKEIATRSNAGNYWSGLFSILPDPDDVLRRAGKSLETYNKMENDPHIWAEMSKRKALTTALKFGLVQGKAQEKYTKLIEEFLLSNDHELFSGISSVEFDEEDDSDIYDLIDTGLNAIFHGYQPVEIVWERVGGVILPVKIPDRPREWFHFDQDGMLRFRSKSAPLFGELLPPKKFLIFRHKASYNNPYGIRLLSKCFWPWMFKHNTEKWKIKFLEKFGSVWAIGKLPRGKENPEYQALYDELLDLINSGIAVVPDDGSVEILEPAGKGTTANIFDGNIKLYDEQISKAILTVTSLTDSDNKGSRASDEVRERMLKALVESDRRDPIKRINRLLNWIFEINGWGISPTAELFNPEEDYDKDRADRDQTLSEQGVKFKKEYYTKHYGFEEEDIEIEDNSEKNTLNFAEGDASSPLKELLNSIPSQRLQTMMEPVIQPVLEAFKNSSTFEEAMEKVITLLPGVNTDELEDFIAKLNTIAYVQGAISAKQ